MHWYYQLLYMVLKRGPSRNLIPKSWAYWKTIVLEQYWTSDYTTMSPSMKYEKCKTTKQYWKHNSKKTSNLVWKCMSPIWWKFAKTGLIKEEIEEDLERGELTWSKKILGSQWQPLKSMQRIERNGEAT